MFGDSLVRLIDWVWRQDCHLRSTEMKLLKRGKGISVSIENITPFGICLYVKEREYFLNYTNRNPKSAIRSPPIVFSFELSALSFGSCCLSMAISSLQPIIISFILCLLGLTPR